MDLWVNHFMSNTFQQYRHYTIIPHSIPYMIIYPLITSPFIKGKTHIFPLKPPLFRDFQGLFLYVPIHITFPQGFSTVPQTFSSFPVAQLPENRFQAAEDQAAIAWVKGCRDVRIPSVFARILVGFHGIFMGFCWDSMGLWGLIQIYRRNGPPLKS